MWDSFGFATAAFAAFLVGLSKAGFGGGLGILTLPLTVLAFSQMERPPSFALGVVLPILCLADFISVYFYRGKWRSKNFLYLLPGVLVGVIIGVRLIDRFSPEQLNDAIGLCCVAFVLLQVFRERILGNERTYQPGFGLGVPCGIGAGITSTFANGAGPLVAMFLIPQRLPKEIYMGTTVLVFAWINWIKLMFFVPMGLVTKETLLCTTTLLPFVPLGAWAGLSINQKLSEKAFVRLVYGFTLLAGLQLIFG